MLSLQRFALLVMSVWMAVLVAACGGGGGGTSGTSSANAGVHWTWMSGSSSGNYARGVYGTLGVAAAGNVPGARIHPVTWIDKNGNRWLFGGFGVDSTGTMGTLNDLWKYDGTNWTWMSGSSGVNAVGVYGTQGVAAAANVPGARNVAMGWTDSAGNFWLFGGSLAGAFNDLWKFDGVNWTWVSGSSGVNAAGVYGTQGVAAATNIPGARDQAVTWIDGTNNLWLFGGNGRDSTGTIAGPLNDLWKFDGTNWTWVSGSSVSYATAVYGTKGVAAATNVPGSRYAPVSWMDAAGNRWLFGGSGRDSTGALTQLNDLWKFDGTNWTWVSGSNVGGGKGVYGTLGVASPSNVPGARFYAVSWMDSSGNRWLFGGAGYDSAGTNATLNDVWKFDGTNWTWMNGSNTANATGSYGTLGTAAASNTPGSREGAAGWTDAAGNFWLFGGAPMIGGFQNDLWRYQP